MVGKVTTIQYASASRIPSIMGHNPYSTPNDELDASIKAVAGGYHALPQIEIEAADWGNDMENMILEKAAKKLGLRDLKLDYPEAYYYKDILQASLDGGAIADDIEVTTDPANNIYVMNSNNVITLSGPGVLESKLTRVAPSDTPALYRGPLQLQAQMLCTGAQWGVIATLYQGVEMYLYLYKADFDVQNQIIMACSDFKRRVAEQDYYPALSAAEATTMHPQADDDIEIEADDDLREKIERLAHLRTELKAYQALVDDLQTDIMNAMGDASSCNAGLYRVTWPMRRVKAKPEQHKIIPAVEEQWVRSKTLKVEGL